MKALNKIMNTFTKTIDQLDDLMAVNEQKAGIAGDKIEKLVAEKTALEKEGAHAQLIAGRLREIITV